LGQAVSADGDRGNWTEKMPKKTWPDCVKDGMMSFGLPCEDAQG